MLESRNAALEEISNAAFLLFLMSLFRRGPGFCLIQFIAADASLNGFGIALLSLTVIAESGGRFAAGALKPGLYNGKMIPIEL